MNRAVADMDKVVQRNAARAEESASEEMRRQSEQLKGVIQSLSGLTQGEENGLPLFLPEGTGLPAAGETSRKAPGLTPRGKAEISAVLPSENRDS